MIKHNNEYNFKDNMTPFDILHKNKFQPVPTNKHKYEPTSHDNKAPDAVWFDGEKGIYDEHSKFTIDDASNYGLFVKFKMSERNPNQRCSVS
jgi:hypothetical protein